MGLEQPVTRGYVIHTDPRGMWVFAYGTEFPGGHIVPSAGAYFIRTDTATRYKWDGTDWVLDSGGGSLVISAVDGSPTGVAAEFQVDEADGLSLSDLGAGVFRLDLVDVPFDVLEDLGAETLLGRGDSGAGAPQEITLGSGLSMTGTTLSATATPAPDQDAQLLAYLWN